MVEPFSLMAGHKKQSFLESYTVTASKPFLEKLNEACRPHIGQGVVWEECCVDEMFRSQYSSKRRTPRLDTATGYRLHA
ncbi:unnamed protein product [Nippostrongylus brasiliensis]|uniref:Transposase n=1 Tax=Nippostrongylus brasiliensis TaxID=27835 RepID=A0A0N4XTV9_NIPBR|nr:unnamed protein product [Nippostrongylus brasiliensis]